MTVTNTDNKVTVLGTGALTSFVFSFIGDQNSDIEVIYTDANGVETTLTEGIGPTQYQLTLNPALPGQLWGLGGTVTYNPNGTPIASGTTLTIARVLPLTQNFSISNQASFGAYLRATEQALDYNMMALQQVSETQNRAIVVPLVDPNPPQPLPPVAQRANKIMAFDNDGDPIAADLPAGSGLISTAMQPVVDASTLADGRTAFGLGNIAVDNIGVGLQSDGAGNVIVNFQPIAIAINTTINSAFHLRKVKATGPIVITLPLTTTLFNGFGFWIENLLGGGNVTIAPNAADVIENGAAGASLIIPPGVSLYITTNAGGTWWVELTQGNRVSAPLSGTYTRLRIDRTGAATATYSADGCVVSDGTYSYTIPLSGTLNCATNGLNGLDTGALGANTFYGVWAIYNPVTQIGGVIASLQLTNNATFLANLPAGFTCYSYLGTMLTEGGSNFLVTRQRGKDVQYASPLIMISGNSGNPAVGPNWTAVPITQAPSTAVKIKLMLWGEQTAFNTATIAAPNNSYGVYTSTTIPPPLSLATTAGTAATVASNNIIGEFIIEGANVFYASNGANTGLSCLGWTEG